jgi:hypothetical protein
MVKHHFKKEMFLTNGVINVYFLSPFIFKFIPEAKNKSNIDKGMP